MEYQENSSEPVNETAWRPFQYAKLVQVEKSHSRQIIFLNSYCHSIRNF